MAGNNQNITDVKSNTFNQGLNKDAEPSFVSEGMWTHARNAMNNSREGDAFTLSNESSNQLCVVAGATLPGSKYVIGAIYLYSDKWLIFTAAHSGTNGIGGSVGSEIGLFDENLCQYRIIVQDTCLNFSKWNLITGASREKEDCTWAAYWADGNNPDRYINIGDPQTWPSNDFQWIGNNTYANPAGAQMQWPGVSWVQDCEVINDCNFCSDTPVLNCNKLRLARLVNTPCVKVSGGRTGGNLMNGSYLATIAYTIKGERVTNWFSLSNVQPIFVENEPGGSLEIDISADTEHFTEFVLCVISYTNQQTQAKEFGVYSSDTTKVYIDIIDNSLTAVDIKEIPIQNVVFEKSDQISEVSNYLLRVGPTSKFDFNYQPLANLIQTNWVSVEYPADYYINGGYKPSYMRDEVYSFFIRWVYNTGDKSSSYHIPGRPPGTFTDICQGINGVSEIQPLSDNNSIYTDERTFEIFNTAPASAISYVTETLDDGGRVLARGPMGYWESTETYPSDKPDIWNPSQHPCSTGILDPLSPYNLCGQYIRHHKFPDNALDSTVHHFTKDTTTNELFIRLLGVDFSNIIYPKDNDGIDIPNIVGYEILRGSREGNQTILAKGMINNMRPYNIPGVAGGTRKGLYPNHPFNTIKPVNPANSQLDGILNPGNQINDPYIINIDNEGERDNLTIGEMPSNVITFHSPDLNISRPYLSVPELKIYGNIRGVSQQYFTEPNGHPQNKLVANLAIWAMLTAGVIEAIINKLGKRTINQPGAGYTRKFGPKINEIDGGASGPLSANIVIASGLATGTASANLNFQSLSGGDTDATPQEYSDDQSDFEADAGITGTDGFDNQFNDYLNSGFFDEALQSGSITLEEIYKDFNNNGGLTKGGSYTAPSYTNEVSKAQLLAGSPFNDFISTYFPDAAKLLYAFSEGADFALNLIYTLLPYRQFALQMQAHGLYDIFNKYVCGANVDLRFRVMDAFYLNNNVQDMKPYNSGGNVQYRINNLKRQNTVVIRTQDGSGNDVGPYFITDPLTTSGYADTSLVTIGTARGNQLAPASQYQAVTNDLFNDDQKTTPFNASIASHYAALKYRIVNQYGQLQNIKQVPITPCEQTFDYDDIPFIFPSPSPSCPLPIKRKILPRTPVLFGGDTYINRYTEKNTMLFFNNWLYTQPDGYEYNYFLRQMVPEPRFWMNSQKYEASNLYPSTAWVNPLPGEGVLPNAYYRLDGEKFNYTTDEIPGNLFGGSIPGVYPFIDGYKGIFGVKESYFYLATSAIRDFFVESEVLVDFRKAGDLQFEKFYDPYRFTDLTTLFDMNPDVIAAGNYYSYDYSLSITKLFTQYFSQGNLQTRYYDPRVASLCYTHYTDRILYSLPTSDAAQRPLDSVFDGWFIYLANNYREFKNQISGVKNYAKSGLFITFKNASPFIFQGVDQLETEAGVKITVGDGTLFARDPQMVTVSDSNYEYGSSQNRFSVISTPAGMYYISQNQGKIFTYSGGLSELSQAGMKWWFADYLPFKLLEDFPDYPHTDNPVAGIGCQTTYDNVSSIVYFSKKDYKLREEYKGIIVYDANVNQFKLGKVTVSLQDETFFERASWTVSFDPKSKYWVSFHDWHPDLVMGTKNTFLTTKDGGIWRHNDTCNDFCNFYGINYPFEIEMPLINGQTVGTLRSMEYILECYRKSQFNCIDQFHVLDHNFDKAVVFNTEQVSGVLNLNIFPKNNVALSLLYPQINLDSIDILFSKEENKYRFNQFWDITRDRGEFPVGSNYPPTGPLVPGTTVLQGPYEDQLMWITEPNGYIKSLNQANLNYNKEQLQRKKFRHYINFLNLSKDVSGDVNMILKIVNNKITYSPR